MILSLNIGKALTTLQNSHRYKSTPNFTSMKSHIRLRNRSPDEVSFIIFPIASLLMNYQIESYHFSITNACVS